MKRFFGNTIVRIVLGVIVVALLAMAIYVYDLASDAGYLPWQPAPTRISEAIKPFEGIPGFGDETATPTP